MIKIDIDMPMTCEQCRFYDGINYDGRWCLAKYSQIYANSSVERDMDCPLIEEKEGEWIPVSEGLPEENTLVLVTVKVRNREPKVRSGYYYKDGFFNIDNGDYWEAGDKELVAWMLLPEPYRAESEDKE